MPQIPENGSIASCAAGTGEELIVEAQGERADMNQGVVPAVDGWILIADNGSDLIQTGLIREVDGEQFRLERADS